MTDNKRKRNCIEEGELDDNSYDDGNSYQDSWF